MTKSKPINMVFRLEAAAWYAFAGGIGALPIGAASSLGAGVVPLIGSLTSAHKTALRNIRMSFPNENDAWHQEVRKGMWHEIGRMAGEFPHMGKFVQKLETGEVEFRGRERVEATLGKGAVFIGGHFSNWEITSLCLAQVDRTSHFTYRPANNPIIDKYIVETRRAFGLELQAAKGKEGGMGLLRSLMKHRSVALMNDQKYNKGLAVPFFGYDCMTADGPTRLALKFKVPLIPILGRRMGPKKFIATAYEPIALDYDNPNDDAVLAGVLRINAFLEDRVREAPEQWFWAHRRWPKTAWRQAGVM
ncbi:MAG: lysophospholipid acyltransferase family protein [Terricaulis sp.]